jgi:hypothetical protein
MFSFVFPQKSNIQQLKEEIREKLPAVPSSGTSRHSHKKSRPAPPPPPPPMPTNGSGGNSDLEIREPSELLVGVPATLTTQWRHRPRVLVAGSVSYVASVSTADRQTTLLGPWWGQWPAPQRLSFRRLQLLVLLSILKMGAVTVVNVCRTTRRHIPLGFKLKQLLQLVI